MPTSPLSILVVHQRHLVGAALADCLTHHGLSASTGDCPTALAALASGASTPANAPRYDVVVLDCADFVNLVPNLPEPPAGSTRSSNGCAIVLLCNAMPDRVLEEALRRHIPGLFSTAESPGQLVLAVGIVADGGVYYSPEIRSRIDLSSGAPRLARSVDSHTPRLTRRETEILGHLARGLTKRQVAELVSLSAKTVDNHCTSIMAKLNVHNRVELARFAIREGFAAV